MTLLSLLMTTSGVRGRPGLAPAGEVLFFASPKKSTQKKCDPGVCDPVAAQRGNLRCSRQAGAAQTRCAQTCASLDPPAAALLGTATRVVETKHQIQQGRGMVRPCGVRLLGVRVPLCMCRGVETGPDQGLRMFEPVGRVCADPGPVEHRRLPRRSRGHRHQGRLFFGDFLLAKQKKVTALPGAYPGKASPARAAYGAK